MSIKQAIEARSLYEVTGDIKDINTMLINRAELAALRSMPAEPVAWMYQHDETGRTGFVDCWQVENGWQANNPRLHLIGPLYTTPPPAPVLSDAEIREIADSTKTAEPGRDGYILPYSFARAIERAVIGRGEKL